MSKFEMQTYYYRIIALYYVRRLASCPSAWTFGTTILKGSRVRGSRRLPASSGTSSMETSSLVGFASLLLNTNGLLSNVPPISPTAPDVENWPGEWMWLEDLSMVEKETVTLRASEGQELLESDTQRCVSHFIHIRAKSCKSYFLVTSCGSCLSA